MVDTSAHAIKEAPGIEADAAADVGAPLVADLPPMPAAQPGVGADGAGAPAIVMAASAGGLLSRRILDRVSRGAGRIRRRKAAVGEKALADDEPPPDGG